ncbi:MAG TPA: sigma-70 family RNA polymerase sigma factor [Steroidobacteraceae bacterium]|nr:sigma-70 family RNA polymerase sigma factor [Steroidobacteraceae bacterium]
MQRTATRPPDRTEFTMFMRDYQHMVYASARRLTASDATAQDITQDVFLKAWEHFADLRERVGAGGWLKTVTLRLSLNHLGRYRRRWRFFSELMPTGSAAGGSDHEASAAEVEFAVETLDTVFASLADAQRDERVRAALTRLPEAQRVPLVLFHFEDRSYQQIAADLEVSVAKVKTDILRGRIALAKLLQETDHGP